MPHRPLNQVIAILKGVKNRVMTRCNDIHHQLLTADVQNGQTRSYAPQIDTDPVYPGEDKHVQVIAVDHLAELGVLTTELFDAEATLDFANCTARANVVVDGQIIVENAPATYLIFLEKQLTDLHTTLAKCLVRDPARAWGHDTGSRLWRALPVKTTKTRKVEKPLVLAAATKEHPAQVKTTVVDELEGTWTTTPLTGSISAADKKRYLDKIQHLIDATKVAREQANMTDAPSVTVGERIMDFIGI